MFKLFVFGAPDTRYVFEFGHTYVINVLSRRHLSAKFLLWDALTFCLLHVFTTDSTCKSRMFCAIYSY